MRVIDVDGTGTRTRAAMMTLMTTHLMHLITIATRTTDGDETALRFRKVNVMTVVRRIPTGLGLGRR